MLSNILHKYKVLGVHYSTIYSGNIGFTLTYHDNKGIVSCGINHYRNRRRFNPYA